MMGFGMVGGMLLFWVVLIVLAVLLVRGLFQTNQVNPTNQSPTARQILQQRYARGEITQEQFQLMMKDLL
jgi:putative membrane protein